MPKPKALVLRPDLNDFRVQAVLEWLTTIPDQRVPGTQSALAQELGISHQYITAWKNDPDFLIEWERRYRKTVGSPEKQHQVLEALHATATDRTDPRMVPAARAYLEAVDAIKPRKIDVTVNKDAKLLSDDELNSLLSYEAEREAQRRGND